MEFCPSILCAKSNKIKASFSHRMKLIFPFPWKLTFYPLKKTISSVLFWFSVLHQRTDATFRLDDVYPIPGKFLYTLVSSVLYLGRYYRNKLWNLCPGSTRSHVNVVLWLWEINSYLLGMTVFPVMEKENLSRLTRPCWTIINYNQCMICHISYDSSFQKKI